MRNPIPPASIDVVYPGRGPFDAIAAHGRGLAAALRAAGFDARLREGGAWMLVRMTLRRDRDWALLAYMPFAYGRGGLSPGLVLAAAAVRLVPGRPRLALLVHEAHVPPDGARNRALGWAQRRQLAALARLAERVLTSTEANARVVTVLAPRAAPVPLPVPSNIAVVASDRGAARRQLGLADGELVVACFGRAHPSRSPAHVAAALDALTAGGRRCVLLNLGDAPPAIGVPGGVRAIEPGPLPEAELSRHLLAADLFLAAFHDGTSTRRTTVSAALAHGVAVVGTDGSQTDELLRAHPKAIVLVPVDDLDGFAAAAARLADDAGERAALGAAGRALYREHIDWPAAANRVARLLDNARP